MSNTGASTCACGPAATFSFTDIGVYGAQDKSPVTAPQNQSAAQPGAGASQNVAGTPAAQPSVTTSAYSIAAAQKTAVSGWIPDPVKPKDSLFGITPLPAFTAPKFETEPAAGAKGVKVKSTHADLQSVAMQFLAPGQYADPRPFAWQCDVMVDRSCYPDGSMIKPHIMWDVTQDGSDLLAAGEQEHCDDFQFAFYAILGRGAELINAMASAGTVFSNDAAARAELRKTTPLDPNAWRSYFLCLAKASADTRDKTNPWHTPLPPTNPAVRRKSRLVSGTALGSYDDFVVVLSPHIGKHSTWEVINAAAASCNAAQATQTASTRRPAGRQPPPVITPSVTSLTGVKPETIIRNWLEQHQFAPPDKQPDEGERHVLLNGEDMKLSDAVKVTATALGQPQPLVNSVITAALAQPIRSSAAGLPFIGPGNRVPGINLASPRDAFGVNPAIAQTVEISTIDEYLNKHGFAAPEIRDPTGDKVLFDGKETTVEQVADHALAILGQYPTLKRADVLARVRQKYVASRGGAGNQIVFGYTLVPKFAQYVSGPADPLNPLRTQHQFSFTITRQHHANDSPGLESSFQGSVTLSDSGIVNVQAGEVEAVVLPLLKGWIQVSGLIQTMASANWNKTASGSVMIVPAVQTVAGGQVLFTPSPRSGDYAFVKGHVQLGIQALAGGQISPNGPSAVANVGFVLNIPF